MWVTLGLVLALVVAACGEDGSGQAKAERTPTPDPSVARLSAACTEYWQTVLAELPPRTHTGYAAYVKERMSRLQRFVDAVRAEPGKGAERARLLAGGSLLLSQYDGLQYAVDQRDFTAALYHVAPGLAAADRKFEATTKKAGVECGLPAEPSAEVREFRTRAGEVCEAGGQPEGLPALDADRIRDRVDGHAALALPDSASDLERETLSMESELADEAAKAKPSRVIVEADIRYLALATRTSEGWSRQGVTACANLPTGF